jgi:hypothetical protein
MPEQSHSWNSISSSPRHIRPILPSWRQFFLYIFFYTGGKLFVVACHTVLAVSVLVKAGPRGWILFGRNGNASILNLVFLVRHGAEPCLYCRGLNAESRKAEMHVTISLQMNLEFDAATLRFAHLLPSCIRGRRVTLTQPRRLSSRRRRPLSQSDEQPSKVSCRGPPQMCRVSATNCVKNQVRHAHDPHRKHWESTGRC